MSNHIHRTENEVTLRDVLRRWETNNAPTPPEFDSVRRRILKSPSPLDAPRWSARRSFRLTIALISAQVQLVPWLVFPVALVTASVAVYSARFFGLTQGMSAGLYGFSSLMLVGVAITITIALSAGAPEAVSLATPLGPQIVVLSRIVVVLVVDVVTGIVASGLVAASSFAGSYSTLVVAWMAPLSIIAGITTFVAIWVTPWTGALLGMLLIPLVMPTANTTGPGLGAAVGALWTALTPAGLILVGLGVLAAAIGSARSAAVARAQIHPLS